LGLVCLHAAPRVQLFASTGIMCCGIIRSCQSAATSEIVKRSWACVRRGAALYQVPDQWPLPFAPFNGVRCAAPFNVSDTFTYRMGVSRAAGAVYAWFRFSARDLCDCDGVVESMCDFIALTAGQWMLCNDEWSSKEAKRCIVTV